MESRERSLADLPSEVVRTATEHLWQYTVGFVDTQQRKGDAVLLGSGIVVRAGSTHAFLTAAHVLDVLPRAGRLALILSTRIEQTSIEVSGIEYRKIARGTVDEDGPDLGAVLLSAPIASSVGAKKSFYNLTSRRARLLNEQPQKREGIWIASGFVGELTKLETSPKPYTAVKAFCHFGAVGGVDSYSSRGPHDYFLFPILRRDDSSIPEKFGGVSGSGLWQVLLRERNDGSLVVDDYLLQGLTYYQDAYVDGKSALRCHGPQSLYEIAYSAVVS
jgi:hypothetical protein